MTNAKRLAIIIGASFILLMILGLIGSMMSDSPSEDLVEPKDTATPTPPPTRPPTVCGCPDRDLNTDS